MIKATETTAQEAEYAADSEMAGIVWQIAGIGFALMAAAALLLWWHFGPVIFFDTLAALQNCF